jgi:hypothetical protein
MEEAKANYDELYKQEPEWILDGGLEPPPGYVGTWSHQEPYGPLPKKEQIIDPRYRKLYELRIKQLKAKYLKSLQKDQMKSKSESKT